MARKAIIKSPISTKVDMPQKVRHYFGAFLCLKETGTIMNLGFNALKLL